MIRRPVGEGYWREATRSTMSDFHGDDDCTMMRKSGDEDQRATRKSGDEGMMTTRLGGWRLW